MPTFCILPISQFARIFCDFRGYVPMITDYMGGGGLPRPPKVIIWIYEYMDDPLIVLPQQHHSNGLRHKRTLAIEKALDIFLINVWRKNIGDDDAGQDKCDWWKIEPLTTRGRATEGWVIVSIFRIFCSNFAFQAFKLGFQYFRRVFYTLQPNNCVFTFNIMHWRFCYGWFSITVFCHLCLRA